MLDFLRRIWPEQGSYCLALKEPKGFKHAFFPTIDAASAAITLLDAAGRTVYMACASYNGARSRKAADALAVRALWMDLDVGEGPGKFLSRKSALLSLKTFLEQTGLPSPLLVDSGGGYHIYWTFARSVSPQDWRPVAAKLKSASAHFHFDADPARTADLASILRPVGSHNFKYHPAPAIAALNAPAIAEFENLRDILGTLKLPALPRVTKTKILPINEDFLIPKHYEKSDPERCLDHCAQLMRFKVEAATLPEPQWYAGIQCLHFCEGGDEKIHEWSKPHPGYTVQQTDAKIRQIAELGPTTCATFEQRNPGGCDGCPHKGKITSPIVLGVSHPELAVPPVLDPDDAIVTASGLDETIDFIAPPKPFKRTGSGIYYIDKDGLEVLVHEYDLFVTDIAYDTFTGYEVATVRHFLPNDGWQRFRFRSSDVGSDKDFERAFRDNHVKPHKPQLLRLYVAHYLQQLQRARRMAKLYGSMGWKDGTNEFVLGTKVFRRDGTVEAVGLSDNVSGSIKGFGSKGELAPWVEQTTLFDSPRLEAHAFSACVWTGAPLMKFTGLQAALFVMVGKTNGGKSSMADFCLSAYGDFRKLQMREDDTETVKDTRMGAFGSLPMYIDETTNKDPKQLSDFVYRVTQGRSKGRGRIDGSERPTNEWNTIVMASSNSSLSARLGTGKANPQAERVRLFEYHVEPEINFGRAASTELHGCIADNFGVAGETYIQYVVTHQDEVAAGLKKVLATLDGLTGAPDEERYISASVACVLYGSMLAKKLGLLNFDVMRLWTWVVPIIKGVRVLRKEDYSDSVELLGRYLNEKAGDRICLDDSRTGQSTDAVVLRYPTRELHQRYEMGSGTLWIERRNFSDWIVSKHEDYENIKQELLAQKVIVGTQRKTLGAGSGLGSVAVECLRIDMNHPLLGNVKVALVAPPEVKAA